MSRKSVNHFLGLEWPRLDTVLNITTEEPRKDRNAT